MPEIPAENARSDVHAKAAFCRWLLTQSYSQAQVCASPADVLAVRNGETWMFEVKFTKGKRTTCFGAATLTEWVAAAERPDHFRFVIAYQRNDEWRFDLYTPEEFMAFSYVPPFKVYFKVPLDGRRPRVRSELARLVHLTKARLRLLRKQFDELRKLED